MRLPLSVGAVEQASFRVVCVTFQNVRHGSLWVVLLFNPRVLRVSGARSLPEWKVFAG